MHNKHKILYLGSTSWLLFLDELVSLVRNLMRLRVSMYML